MCVCVAIWDDHCYFYKERSRATDICKNMLARMPQALPAWRLKSEMAPSKGELVALPWVGVDSMAPGVDYHSDDLEAIRFQFLASRRNPKVSLAGGPREIKKLTNVFSSLDNTKGECRIHRTSVDAEAIKAWYWALPGELRYEGENLPFASRKVLRNLLRHPRGQLYRDQREALWTTQGEKCAICAERVPIDACDADHDVPLEECGSNEDGNWQILCFSCHREKSNSEAFRASYDTLESRFAPSVYEAYVKSPKALPLVFQHHVPPEEVHQGLLMMDCIRCRRNALYDCAVPLPVFSPLDRIEPCTGALLGDLTYIDAPLPKATGALIKTMPFQGPGWYTLPAAQWLLHTGKISWDMCTHKIDGHSAPLRLSPTTARHYGEGVESHRPWEAIREE
jgi:5-methylcytosine-specific restriction endonuclease McrA